MEEYLKSLLLKIARNLNDHIENGQPYGLNTFYDERVPLSPEQKKILEAWLAYQFKDVWANSWIKPEAKALEAIADAVKEHETVCKITLDKEQIQDNKYLNHLLYH